MVVRSPYQESYPADAHTSVHKSVLESADPAWIWSVHLDAPGQQHGQQPVSGTDDPGVVKQDKSSTGSVDTTKTCLDQWREATRPPRASKPKPWPPAKLPSTGHCFVAVPPPPTPVPSCTHNPSPSPRPFDNFFPRKMFLVWLGGWVGEMTSLRPPPSGDAPGQWRGPCPPPRGPDTEQ